MIHLNCMSPKLTFTLTVLIMTQAAFMTPQAAFKAAKTRLQDRATQEELDDLARSGDRMRRYVEHKKAETAFRLWDLDSDGRVLREKVVGGLLRCALARSEACSAACICTRCSVLATSCSPTHCSPKLSGLM